MELEELERLLEEDEDLLELVEAWLAESRKATDDLEAALEDQELLVLLKEHLSGRGDGETATEPSAHSSSKSRTTSGYHERGGAPPPCCTLAVHPAPRVHRQHTLRLDSSFGPDHSLLR